MKVFQNMSKCDKMIQTACDIKLEGNESSEVSACNKVMGEFRIGAESCKTKPSNCSCWTDLVKDVPSVRKCNIGNL